MYGFNKIKNDRGVHEFKHLQFKKNHYEELANIKRKNILADKADEQNEKEIDSNEFNNLRDKLEDTKISVENVTQQNTSLIAANKEIAGQLYNFKQEYENRLFKFFFMFYFIVNNRNESILSLLRKTLNDLGLKYENDLKKSVEQRTIEAMEYITNQMNQNSNCEHTIMNKLLNAFTFYINVGDHSLDDLYIPDEMISRVNDKMELEDSDYDFRPYNNFKSNSGSNEKQKDNDFVAENNFKNGVDIKKNQLPNKTIEEFCFNEKQNNQNYKNDECENGLFINLNE